MRYALGYLVAAFLIGRFLVWLGTVIKVDATPQGWRIHL